MTGPVYASPAAREAFLDHAIAVGRFPSSRRAHYRRLHEADPQGTETFVASLAPVNDAPEEYDQAWLSREERKRIAAAADDPGRPRIVSGV